MCETIGIPVMGHVGLTPQTENMLGGFRIQGRTAAQAMSLLEDVMALQDVRFSAQSNPIVFNPIQYVPAGRVLLDRVGVRQ